ncbi:hypothetical protein [Planosporangium thailandense]|uniref:hypothetical protein n=1 Tax=Planosporangium thailandense TaxID=765197 RepID=UPI00197C679C|nr:hypothetical protein [Planosporangium thailandense]
MSYPDSRCLADGGEVSAVLQPATRQPDRTVGAAAVHYLATSASTRGEFGLY